MNCSALADEVSHPLSVHIGIASGQVVASGTGSDSHREYTVTGDSVNLASRLQDTARLGETLISDALYRAIAESVDCVSLGDIAVKGIDAPVRAWRVGALRAGDAGRDRVTFVGRRAELSQFSGAAEACRTSGAGQAIVLRGEAGMGKTRLVEEFTRLAAELAYASHRGLVLDFGVGKGREAIGSLVRSLLGITLGSGKALRRVAADAAVGDGVIAADQRVFLNDLLDLAQRAGDRARYDAMDNATRNDGKRAVIADLTRGAAKSSPILVIVENVHWADPLTLSHVAAMAGAVADCPALLVMTSRIEGDPLDAAWRAATAGCPLMTIDLGPLRQSEALTFASAFIDATNQFARDCIERAGGNPLFLEQLLHNAEERGDDEVPASIQSLVLARMDRLTPADKRALQAASVIGQRFAIDLLRHLLDDADYGCAGLLQHHLARPEGDDYLFAHALIQEGVYSSLLKATRHALHVRAAGWFADQDPVLHAQHIDKAEHPEAATAYLHAARARLGSYHYDAAVGLVRRGLEIVDTADDEFELVCLDAELSRLLGQPAASIDTYERALILVDDDISRCRARIGIGAGCRLLGDYGKGVDVLTKAHAIATTHGLDRQLAQIHYYLGSLEFAHADIEGCLEHHKAALEHATRAGDTEWQARALSGLGDGHYALGLMRSAEDRYAQCLDIAREHGFGEIEVANIYILGNVRRYMNDFETAFDDISRAADMAANIGNRRAELVSLMLQGEFMIDRGAAEKADEPLRRAFELADRMGNDRLRAYLLCHQARACIYTDRPDRARELLGKGLELSDKTDPAFIGPRLFGTAALAADDADHRHDLLRRGTEIIERGCIAHNWLFFYRDAIESCLRGGDWDEAERYASVLEDATRPEPLPWSDFFIARGRAPVTFGRGQRDHETMRRLQALRDEAARVGIGTAVPALDAALARIE